MLFFFLLKLFSFVFILSIGLYLLFLSEIRVWRFKKKVSRLIEWAKENPNLYTTEPEPLRLIKSMNKLRRKLVGNWPRYIEKPQVVILMLRRLEWYPNSYWDISGRALEKMLKGEDIPEGATQEIILRVDPSEVRLPYALK
ncbi:MAG: hypothetical protein WCO18_00775 [bacterium]